jgi:two-component system OmpR family sensor kinase
VSDTLIRRVHIELMVAGIVLALLAIGAVLLLRVGLRPLEQIAETAVGIADGDLDVRVAPADAHPEIGRLGLALNEMLERLEDARGVIAPRRSCGGSSPAPRTSCARRLPRSGGTRLFRRGAQDNPEDLAKPMARIESEASRMRMRMRMRMLIDDMLRRGAWGRTEQNLALRPLSCTGHVCVSDRPQ